MNIAISSSGRTLDSTLDVRFGRCEFFVIYNSEKGELKALENLGQLSGGGAGIAAAQQIIDEKVDAIITGNLGPNAYELIKRADIKVYSCGSIPVKTAIEKCQSGDLAELKEAGPSHNGMGHGFKGGR